ncbi:MAG: hypothetical protein JXO22_17095, partial [Phycisphaerae bacterium]|nr:hypothetical protein [Phycisphaerae bacterium]
GVVERRTGTCEMNRLGGLARVLPGTFLCCSVAALAISGIPPLNGFVSKWLVYQSCLSLGTPLAMLCLIAAVFGSALTLASFFKVLAAVFLGAETPVARREGPVNGAITLVLPMGVLAALCIGFGVWAQWPLMNLVMPAVAETGVDTTEFAATTETVIAGKFGLWGPETATALLALGAIGGLVLYFIGQASRVRVTNSFIGGEVFSDASRLKFPATSFYRTIEDMPGLGAALGDGSRSAYDVYRMGGHYGGALIDVLRKQHTGVLSLYVSWCLVGVVVIVACLMTVK